MIDLVKMAVDLSLKEDNSAEGKLTDPHKRWLRDQFKQFAAQTEIASKSSHDRPSVMQTREMWGLVTVALQETICQIERELPPEFDKAWIIGWNAFLAFEKSPDPSSGHAYRGYAAAMQWIAKGNGRPVAFTLLEHADTAYTAGWNANPAVTKNPYPNFVEGDRDYRTFEYGRASRRQYDYHHLSVKNYCAKYGIAEKGMS